MKKTTKKKKVVDKRSKIKELQSEIDSLNEKIHELESKLREPIQKAKEETLESLSELLDTCFDGYGYLDVSIDYSSSYTNNSPIVSIKVSLDVPVDSKSEKFYKNVNKLQKELSKYNL